MLIQGDIIFLSDQDDVWYKNKIETVVRKYKENPNIFPNPYNQFLSFS